MKKRRTYGTVQRFLWKDPEYQSLGDQVKLLWLCLLTTPRATICPGLIEASLLTVMEDLQWDRLGGGITSGMNMTTDAIDQLKTLASKDGAPWLVVDQERRIIVLPGAVAHNLPANLNVVRHWVRGLAEIPECEGRRVWVESAYRALRAAFGKDDQRTKAIFSLHWHETRGRNGDEPEINDGEASETAKESETVSQTKSKPSTKPRRNRSATNNNNINNSNNSKPEPSKEGKQGTGKAGAPASTPKATKKKVEKPEEPPGDFSKRELAMWEALRSAAFYVPGEGEMTGWDAVKDPVGLARRLGGPAYPAVDPGLIHRLANWTQTNRSRGKKDVARFLTNRFGASQEKGGDRRGTKSGPGDEKGYRFGGDLADKKRRKGR